MTTEEFKGKLIGYCFISKDLIYIDNKKAIELINQFKEEISVDFMTWLIEEKYCLQNPVNDCVDAFIELSN